MRAVAVHQFKEPPVALELPAPTAGEGEVVVRLAAAGMNPFDAKIADGIFAGHRPHVFPLVLGVDGAGIVESVAPGVARLAVGDTVFGSFLHDPVGRGTYAEAVVIPEGQTVVRLPSGIDPVVAASLPTAGMTALVGLDALRVPRGGSVIVVGASGGVGSFAIPLAVARGLRPIAVARADSHERLRRLGAEPVDATDPRVGDRVKSLAPGGADGLLDLASDATRFPAFAALVRTGGRAASTTYATRAESAPPGVTVLNIEMKPRPGLLEQLAAEIVAGRLRPSVESVITLDEAPAALAALRAGKGRGKTVIRLASR